MPLAFFLRRIHSLIGFLFVLFIFEHLITNAQAAYFLNESQGFIKTVNLIHSIPYLPVIEVVLIGIPIFSHAILGIQYITSAKNNVKTTDGTKPSLKYPRNRAYYLQRTTSYILIFFLIFHVIQMRFIKYPTKISFNNEKYFLVKIKNDEHLNNIIKKIDASLIFDKKNINNEELLFSIDKIKLKKNEIIALTKQSGLAFLLIVRETFKNPFMVGLYSIFVLAASFHAINGLWTFLISWGFIISSSSQRIYLNICFCILLFILALGFISIWSSFLY